MTQQTAQMILYAIAVVAAVAWMAGLQFLVRSARIGKAAGTATGQFPDEMPPENLIFGHAEVEGRADRLSAKAASVLAGESARFGYLKIVQRTDESLRFEAAAAAAPATPAGQCLRRGQLRFTPLGADRTRIDYGIEVSAGRGLLWGGAVFVALGLVALVVGCWAIQTWVVPNPHPAVRGQTFQMFQVVHFLWPPFLLGGIYRVQRRAVRDGFDALIHNLPYYEKATP
jgi:hypothetical protein